jgi:hypothetical protein
MKLSLSSTKWKILIAGLLGVSTLAYCAPSDWFGLRKPDFEFTGQVLDFDTKQPIEGAYALAVYKKASIGFGGTADYCYKTKGMMTGKDGKFSFPIENPKSDNPEIVHAIKPDYFLQTWAVPSHAVQKAQNKEAFSNRHVYLKKQDPAKPSFQHGFSYCERPESRAAVESAAQFLELKLVEQRKYSKNSSDSLEYFIDRMKNPEKQP